MTNKAAIYIRVSTHWQVDRDSLNVQKRELQAYCEMILNISEYEVFEDPGYSAKNTDRPAYQNMMARLRSGEFSHLLVWKIDRISRNLLDFTSMYQELKNLGITFVSKNEQFDTSSAIGEAMLKIILIFAELERKMTAERVTAVMISRANNGQWNGGRIPYGYKRVDDDFVVDEQESEVYNFIKNSYLGGMSILTIARTLNENEIKTRAGNAWSTTGVHKLLTNPFYTGTYVYNKNDEQNKSKRKKEEWITIEDHHTPLASKIEFDKIQTILKSNHRSVKNPQTKRTSKYIHVFAGLTTCGVCGATMTVSIDRERGNGFRPSMYGCSNRRRFTDKCPNKFVNDIKFGSTVFTLIGNIMKISRNPEYLDDFQTFRNELQKGLKQDISAESISILLEIIKGSDEDMIYAPTSIFSPKGEGVFSERSYLEDRIRKNNTALKRLQTLYLYGTDELPESQYIIERKKIIDDIRIAESKLNEISESASSDIITLEKQLSFAIMNKLLLSDEPFDYEKFIAATNKSVPRDFINSIISNIVLIDGYIKQITFKNELTIRLEIPKK